MNHITHGSPFVNCGGECGSECGGKCGGKCGGDIRTGGPVLHAALQYAGDREGDGFTFPEGSAINYFAVSVGAGFAR